MELYLSQMIGIFSITFFLLLRLCECFPQLNDKRIARTSNLEPMFKEVLVVDVENAKSALELDKDRISDNAYGNEMEVESSSNSFLPKSNSVLKSIRLFTETSIVNILKNYLDKLKSSAKTIAVSSDRLINNGNTSNVIQTDIPTLKNQKSMSKVIYNKNKPATPSAVGVQTLKMSAPAKSVIDRWLPGLQSYRRKRSYYGYDNGYDDFVYGAHTSPCDSRDIHYCLNGGTCVFVRALEMKTCRCQQMYKGLRCESINVEFLLAALFD
ncbi:Pro-neuregulin-4 [Mactra antiquata]